MKLLVISHKPPYPIVDGGTFAIANFIKLLLDAGFQVDLFTLETPKHKLCKSDTVNMPSQLKLSSVYVDTTIRPLHALGSYFSKMPYNVKRFLTNEVAEKLLHQLQTNTYDIIQLESPVLFPYIPLIKANSTAKIVYRAHNLEFELFAQRARIERNLFKRLYLNRLSKQLKSYEMMHTAKFDAVNYISTRDEREAKKLVDIKYSFSIALSFQSTTIENEKNINPKSFGIVGSMNWEPNVESTLWFIEKVWIKLVESNSDIKLFIAGNHMHPSIRKYNNINGITVHENVENIKDIYNKVSSIIIPLQLGSGLKIKTIEALRYNKLIFSTSIGLQGIVNCSEANIIKCNSAQEFIESIKDYLDTYFDKKIDIELNKIFIEKYYSNSTNIPLVLEHYKNN